MTPRTHARTCSCRHAHPDIKAYSPRRNAAYCHFPPRTQPLPNRLAVSHHTEYDATPPHPPPFSLAPSSALLLPQDVVSRGVLPTPMPLKRERSKTKGSFGQDLEGVPETTHDTELKDGPDAPTSADGRRPAHGEVKESPPASDRAGDADEQLASIAQLSISPTRPTRMRGVGGGGGGGGGDASGGGAADLDELYGDDTPDEPSYTAEGKCEHLGREPEEVRGGCALCLYGPGTTKHGEERRVRGGAERTVGNVCGLCMSMDSCAWIYRSARKRTGGGQTGHQFCSAGDDRHRLLLRLLLRWRLLQVQRTSPILSPTPNTHPPPLLRPVSPPGQHRVQVEVGGPDAGTHPAPHHTAQVAPRGGQQRSHLRSGGAGT